MALTVSFTAQQVIGEPSEILLTDTTTGTDVTITKRRVYLTKVDSNTLVPDGTSTTYVEWNSYPGTTTITIDALDKDYALLITVQWLTVLNVVTYTDSETVMVSMFNDTFEYALTQAASSNTNLLSSKNYYWNKMKLIVELDSAANAIAFASDRFNAQACLDRATYLRNNPQLFH